MNKRLRKKRHIGEFKELGFEAFVEFKTGMTHDDFDVFLDQFLAVNASRQLVCGGGGSPSSGYAIFITKCHHGSATEDDRKAVDSFIAKSPNVASFKIGALVDAWHPT